MKKLLILLFGCLFSATTAGAWGLLGALVSFDGNPYIYKNSFLYYVLTTKNPKVRVCVSTEGTNTDPARQKITRDYFVKSTQSAFDTWLSFVRTQLGERQSVQSEPTKSKKKAKKQQPIAPAPEFARKAEFADILAALPRRIELQLINPNGEDCERAMKGKYDLRIKSLGNFQYGSLEQQESEKRGDSGAIKGVYNKDKTIWLLSLPGNDEYTAHQLALAEVGKTRTSYGYVSVSDYTMERVTRHEVGHFFGLADQYADKQNMDKVRSLLRTEPRQVVFGGLPSVMAKSETLTCDDLEGFINAVDFIWGMEGKTSPRVQNGWKSLCGKPYIYLQGIPAKDAADLAKVQAYLKSWKQNAGAAVQLVQLAQDWKAYLGKVEQARDARCEAVQAKRTVGVSLDKQGLALSAECQYLMQKADKIRDIIKQQIEPLQEANSKGNASSQQISQLVQNLSQYKGQYAPGSEVLDAKGVLTAKPMDSDFSSVTYPCLVCGKPVGKENGYLSTDVVVNGGTRPPYHIHLACEGQLQSNKAKLGGSYQHKATRRTVPTWAQLTQSQGNNNPLLAQLGTEFTPTRKTTPVVLASPVPTTGSTVTPRKTTPAATPVKPAGATSKKTTPAESKSQKPASSEKTAPVKQVPSAAPVPAKPVQTVVATAPKAKCVVCKQEMADGTFYTDSVGRTVHKHSLCAYRFFKRFHKTDEDSLTRYSDYYFFSMPNDVVQAKADMRKLDLTFADIRRYRAQDESAAAEFKKSLEAEKAAKAQAQAKAEKCRLVVQVTPKDVQAYEKENKAVLSRIAQKEEGGRTLSKKEAAVKRYYKQLKDNLALTEACKG